MSERRLEIARQPDGRFLASADGGATTVEVSSWDDIRTLRDKRHLVDHWADGDQQAFIDQHGSPFEDWWRLLSPACAEALMADPRAAVPVEHDDEVKRTLRHQPRQAGLGLEGSGLSAQLRAFVAEKSRPRRPAQPEDLHPGTET